MTTRSPIPVTATHDILQRYKVDDLVSFFEVNGWAGSRWMTGEGQLTAVPLGGTTGKVTVSVTVCTTVWVTVSAGRVRVNWRIVGDRLEIVWKERNGPPVQQPTRKGFGRVVSEQVLSSALSATVEVDFAPDGLQWTMILPAAEFSRQA